MKRVAEGIAGALVLIATGCSANDPGINAHRAGEPDVVLPRTAPLTQPVPILEVRVSDPEPVPMPRVEPSEPRPVPIPKVLPAQPGPVPMPRALLSEPGSTLLPGYGPR